MNRCIGCMCVLLLLIALFSSCKTTVGEALEPSSMEEQATMKATTPASVTTEYVYPAGTPPNVKENAESLFRELDIRREEFLKDVDPVYRELGLRRDCTLISAERLAAVGVKEIVEVNIEILDTLFGLQITDSAGGKYYAVMNSQGIVWSILDGDKNGDYLWFPVE